MWSRLLKNGSFWLCVLVITTIVFVKDMVLVFWNRFIDPSPIHILQEVRDVADIAICYSRYCFF